MLHAGDEVCNALGTRMTQIYALLDGGALTGEERMALRQHAQAMPLYAFTKDPQAEGFGPWLLPWHVAESLNVAERLKRDDGSCWALSTLCIDASIEDVTRHLASMCHIWTADGQRYFLRFADGRSMRAVWSVLSETQQERVAGALQSWTTTARDGSEHRLFERADASRSPSQRAPFRLTLTDPQLEALLALNWPDQLLAAVLEESPSLSHGRSAAKLHELSAQTCEWLKKINEERFPRQKASLAHVLGQRNQAWAPPPVET